MRLAVVISVTFALGLAACGDDSSSPDMAMPDLATPDLVPPAPGDVGNPCSTTADCNSGERCIPDQYGFPGGYCTLECSAAACPTGSACIPVQQVGMKYCFATCKTDGDCRQGYSCIQGRVCLPASAAGGDGVMPGLKNGQACSMPTVSPTPGDGLFGPNVEVSASAHSSVEAETELSVDAKTKNVVVSWIAINPSGTSNIGWATSTADGAQFSSPSMLGFGAPAAIDNNSQSDPVVANDGAGNFYIAWIGFDRTSGNQLPRDMTIYVAHSSDGGVTFPDVSKASPPGEWTSQGILDKPWIAVSPKDGSVWVTWDRADSLQTGPVHIRLARSTDKGKTWSTPLSVSDESRPLYDRNLAQIAVGPDGHAYVVWFEVQSQQFGDPSNAVWFQRLAPDGTLDGGNVKVTGGDDSPAFEDPSIAVDAATGNLYAGFVSGNASGAWDVRVAASLDGGKTWQPSVKANDDATCATHFHHQIAVDAQGGVHAIWYDNRYFDGNVMHAAAPAADAMHPLVFGKNTFVDDQSSTFTTGRAMSNWVGDYLGLATAGGEIYACWTDNRVNNVSHVYFAQGKL